MSCTYSDVISDLEILVRHEFRGNAKSVRFEGMKAIISYGPQYQVKERDEAYRMAQRKLQKVYDFIEDKLGPAFTKGWGSIDSSKTDAIEVYLEVPYYVREAYARKKARNFQRDINYFMGDRALMEQEQGLDDELYQLFTSSGEAPDAKLERVLIEFLKENDINVEYVNDLRDRKGISAAGISFLADRVIKIAKNKADITTLPEEAAHFIVEMLRSNETLYRAMYNLAKRSDTFTKVYEEYSEVYNNNEEKIVKETMGKILADYIIKRHKNMQDLPTNRRNLLQRILRWIYSFFGKTKSEKLQEAIDDVYGEIANKIFNKTLETDPTQLGAERIDHKKSDPLVAELMSGINRMFKRADILEAKSAEEQDENKAESLRRAAAMIRYNLYTKREPEAAVALYLDYIDNEELSIIINQIRKFREDPKKNKLTSFQINRIQDIIDANEASISDINRILKWTSEFKDIYNKVEERLKSALNHLSEAKEFVDILNRNRTQEIILENRVEGSKLSVEDIVNSSIGDIGYLSRWFGPLRTSSNEVLRMVYNMVANVYNETHREVISEGNEMLLLQEDFEKAGFSGKDLHELDENGKKTGFLIAERKWGEYYKAREKVRQDLMKHFNKEVYSDIIPEELDEDELKYYNKKWSEFFKKYHKYVDGQSIPNPPINEEFQKRMKNKAFAAYYNKVLEIHRKSKEMLPRKYKTGIYEWMLPQIRKDIMQTIKDSENPLFKELKSRIKENFTITEDDIDYGSQDVLLDINGKVVKKVPVHYTKRLEDPNQLSNDITSMYALYYEMALNFRSLSSRLEDIMVIKRVMGSSVIRPQNKTDNEGNKLGYETNAYQALEDFINAYIYGEEKNKSYITLPNGKRVEISKLVDKFRSLVRSSNLFFNIPTIISGHVKGSIDSKLEDVMGLYTTQESKLFAEAEFDRNLPKVLLNAGKRYKETKMEHLFMRFGVSKNTREIFKRLDMQDRLSRTTSDDLLYGMYEASDFRVKGKFALAVMDNFRLVDGKFITKAQFDRLIHKKGRKWSDFKDKTLYNAYDFKNNRLIVKPEFKKYVTKDIENRVANIIADRTASLEGVPGRLDRAQIYRGMWGRMLMLHRGWMITGAADRFKKGGINYQTGEFEEGYYRTVGRVIGKLINDKNVIKYKLSVWETLSEYEKRNVRKFMTDSLVTAGFMILARIIQGIADDDDDDWELQYLAYQFNRIELEQAAFFNPREIPNILNSPSAAVSTFEDLQNLFFAIWDNEEIEYGAYEGMTQREKFLIKRTILKNIWELPYIKDKNKYIKTQIL